MLLSCNDIYFDSQSWKSWKESESNMHLRWDMTDDLISNYDLNGKSINEIEELLGEGTQKCNSDNCTIRYDLGPCRRGISYGSLSIRFYDGKAVHINKSCG